MNEGMLLILGLILELLVFYCFGCIAERLVKFRHRAATALVFGYILYFALFEVIEIPFHLLRVRLSVFTSVWLVIMLAAVIAAVYFIIRGWEKRFTRKSLIREHSWFLVVLLCVIFFQLGIVLFYQDGGADAAYYVGTVNTSIYTNTLGRYDPYSGALLERFFTRYLFSAYPMHNAVWCRLLSVSALIQSKQIMWMINIVMANLSVFLLGERLFRGDKKKADVMVCFFLLLNLFTGTLYTPGTFLLTRGFEGKALVANISVVFVLYCSIWLWQEKKPERTLRIYHAAWVSAIAALAFSGSSIILPAAFAAGFLPSIIRYRRFKDLLRLIPCVAPQAVYLVFYLLDNKEIFRFPAS